MRDLRVSFPGWNLTIYLPGSENDNLYTYLLGKNYNVIIDSINPDVIFYDPPSSAVMDDIKKHKNCIKIYITNEPNPYHPNDISIYQPATTWISGLRQYESLKNADYIFSSFKIDSPKNYYIPCFLFWFYHHVFVSKIISLQKLTNFKSFTKDDIKDKKFSIYLQSNPEPVRRKLIYNRLNEYKHVDIKRDVQHLLTSQFLSIEKINILKNYKFSFAMQNHFIKELLPHHKFYPGFICEKIMDSYVSNTIPIYYGNDMITDYFNEKSFLNWHSFDSDESFVNKIIELDQNDDLYLEYLNQPTFLSLNNLKLDEIAEYLKKIIEK